MVELAIPGDNIDQRVDDSTVFGPGIYQVPLGRPLPSKAGIIQSSTKRGHQVLYVDSNSKRYIPAVKDHVIGVISGKHSEGYRVTLQDHSPPIRLGQFAFENATKKNRPNLNIGTLVYGRVVAAEKDIEGEMECFDATTGKAAGFGELKGGYVFEVSLAYARELLFKNPRILSAIGESVSYEIAIGVNGKIWIDAPDNKTILKVAQCIQASQDIPTSQVDDHVTKYLSGKN
ncbi:hypothetical protein TRICI_004616 [Trichomonascus ciferrii]|uniref:Ribosomal RNA-processing protein 40 n=1 Tax=Trichomonascus ciferrii TaxID=44093 RepID=A0A642V0K2_9ASCO|nr:hypothetical protein TRICI_004616 [Trichomonascus ciferrii]